MEWKEYIWSRRALYHAILNAIVIGLLVVVVLHGDAFHHVIPSWIKGVGFGLWLLVLAGAVVPIMRYRERVILQDVTTEQFRMEPGEQLLLRLKLFVCYFYPHAQDFKPKIPFRYCFQVKPPFWMTPMLTICLTDRRLAARSISGYTWRVIPFSDIRQVENTYHAPFMSVRSVLVVEYEFKGRREAIVLPDNSIETHKLANLLSELTRTGSRNDL